MKKTNRVFAACALLAVSINAQAAVTLSLEPNSPTVLLGEQFNLDVFYDTGGANTVGGAFSVSFDEAALTLLSVSFSEAYEFTVDKSNSASVPFNLGFGSFAGLQGSSKAMTLAFEAIQLGATEVILGAPLAGDDPFPEGANYLSAQVDVVPLPAAAWLFLSGLTGIGYLTRRSRHA